MTIGPLFDSDCAPEDVLGRTNLMGDSWMPQIAFAAYAVDCVLSGRLDLPDGVRLTDYLNETDAVHLQGVEATALADGRVVTADELDVDVEELCVADAAPAPTDRRRRVATRVARVQVQVGPYNILGQLHGPTTGDPLQAVSRRKRMIPLTDATLSFAIADQQYMIDLGVVIVNRHLSRLARAPGYVRTRIDEMGLSPVDPRAKDLTGEVFI